MSAPRQTAIAGIVTGVRPRQARSLLRPGTRTIALPSGQQASLTVAPPAPAPRPRVIRLVGESSNELYSATRMARLASNSEAEYQRLIRSMLEYGAILENDVYGWRGFPNKFVVRRKPESSVFTFIKFNERGVHHEEVTEEPEIISENWDATLQFFENWRRGERVPIFTMSRVKGGRRVEYTGRDLPPYDMFEGEKPLPQIELIRASFLAERWFDADRQEHSRKELPNLADPEVYFTYKMPAIHSLIPDPNGDLVKRGLVAADPETGRNVGAPDRQRYRRATPRELDEQFALLLDISRELPDIKESIRERNSQLPWQGIKTEWRHLPWARSEFLRITAEIRSRLGIDRAGGHSSDIDMDSEDCIVVGETILTIWWPPAGRADEFDLSTWVHPWNTFVFKEDKGTRAIRAAPNMCAYKAAVLTVGRKVPLRKNTEIYSVFNTDGVCANSICWQKLRELLPTGETLTLVDCRGGNIPIDNGEKCMLVSMEGERVDIESVKNVIALVDGRSGPHWLPMSDEKLRSFLARETKKLQAAVQKHTEKREPQTIKQKNVYIDFETAKDCRDNTTTKHRHYVYGAAIMYDDVAKHFRPQPAKSVMTQLIEYLEGLPFKFTAVMFNGRGFDSHFLVEAYTELGYRVSTHETIVAGSKYLKVGVVRGNFQASWDPNAFIPTSLDRAARDFGCESGGKIAFSHDEIEQLAEEAALEVSADAEPNEIMVKIWDKIAQNKGEKAVSDMIEYNIQDVRILKEVSEKLIACLKTCSVDLIAEYAEDARQQRIKLGLKASKKKPKKAVKKVRKEPPISAFMQDRGKHIEYFLKADIADRAWIGALTRERYVKNDYTTMDFYLKADEAVQERIREFMKERIREAELKDQQEKLKAAARLPPTLTYAEDDEIAPLDPTQSPTISSFAFSCLSKALSVAREIIGEKHEHLYTLLSTRHLFAGCKKRAQNSAEVLSNVLGDELSPEDAAYAYEKIIRQTLIGGRCEITNPITLREEKFSIDADTPNPSTTEIPLTESILVPDINGLYSHGARGLFATGELEVAQGLDDVRTKAGVHLVDIENQPAKAMIPIRTEDGRWDWKAGANYPAHDVEMGGVRFHRPEQVGQKITERWTLSTDIEHLLDKGAKITWHCGFNYTSRFAILEPFVRICDKRKNEAGVSPALRSTWKIFQNSTYGKFLQKNRSETKSRIFSDVFTMNQEIVESPFEQVMGEAPQTLEVSEMTGGAWFVRVRAPWKPSNLPGIVGAQVYAHSRAHVYNNYFYPLAQQMPVRSPIACDTDSAFMPLSSYRILLEREAAKGPNEPQFLARDEKDKKTGLSVVETACDKAIFAARKAYWLSANRLHEPGYCAELAPYAFTPEKWEQTKTSELKPKTRLKGCRAASNPPPQWELKRGEHIVAHGKGIGEDFFSAAVKHNIRETERLMFSHWHIKSSRTAGVMLLRGWKKFTA